MFFIIKQQDKKQKHLFSNLFSKRYIVKEIRAKNFSFMLLELKNKKLINSKKAKKIIGRYRVLMSKEVSDVCQKDYFKKAAISTCEYEQKLFANGIAELFSPNKTINSICILIDMQAKYIATANCTADCTADFLVNSFKTVYIITRKKEQYQKFAEKKFYECGAAVLIFTNLQFINNMKIDNIGVIISFENTIENAMADIKLLGIPIITLNYCIGAKGEVLHSFRAKITAEYQNYLPCTIDSHLFLAALYKYCGVIDKNVTIPQTVYVNEKCETINSMKIHYNSSLRY